MLNLGILSGLLGKERFENFKQHDSFPIMLAVVMICYLCISGILLRYLWNTYVVKLASGLRPINGLLDAIFIKVFFILVLS